jgi:serine/threonine protein kinase
MTHQVSVVPTPNQASVLDISRGGKGKEALDVLSSVDGFVATKQASGGASGDVFFGQFKGQDAVGKRIDTLDEIEYMKLLEKKGVGIPLLETKRGAYVGQNAIIMPKAAGDGEIILKGAFDEAQFFKVATESSNAMRVMHANNLVHNDWKLDNLLLHDGQFKVADLGSARPRETPIEAGISDPRFRDPGQGLISSTNGDVYAQGMTLGLAYLRKDIPHLEAPDLKLLRTGNPNDFALFHQQSSDFQYYIRNSLYERAVKGDAMAGHLVWQIHPYAAQRPSAEQVHAGFQRLSGAK